MSLGALLGRDGHSERGEEVGCGQKEEEREERSGAVRTPYLRTQIERGGGQGKKKKKVRE